MEDEGSKSERREWQRRKRPWPHTPPLPTVSKQLLPPSLNPPSPKTLKGYRKETEKEKDGQREGGTEGQTS